MQDDTGRQLGNPVVQVDQLPVLPEERPVVGADRVDAGTADHLAGVVDGVGRGGGPAQRAEVTGIAVAPPDGMHLTGAVLRFAHHDAAVVDVGGDGGLGGPAQRAQVLQGAAVPEERVQSLLGRPGRAHHLATLVHRGGVAVVAELPGLAAERAQVDDLTIAPDDRPCRTRLRPGAGADDDTAVVHVLGRGADARPEAGTQIGQDAARVTERVRRLGGARRAGLAHHDAVVVHR
jgi:hypothetical protein